jgi:hypothetical protein
VALGEPGMPVICWACAVTAVSDKPMQYASNLWQPMIRFLALSWVCIVIPLPARTLPGFPLRELGQWKSGPVPPFLALRACGLVFRRRGLRALAR